MLAVKKVRYVRVGTGQLSHAIRRHGAAACLEPEIRDLILDRRAYDIMAHAISRRELLAIEVAQFGEPGLENPLDATASFERLIAQPIDEASAGPLFGYRQAGSRLGGLAQNVGGEPIQYVCEIPLWRGLAAASGKSQARCCRRQRGASCNGHVVVPSSRARPA